MKSSKAGLRTVRRAVTLALVVIAAATVAWVFSGRPGAANASGSSAPSPDPAHRFAARLQRAGRAETSITRSAPDPLSGKSVSVQGRVAIEPPDRLSLQFSQTGERLTLRSDGGEWMQPSLGQMLKLGTGQATAAGRWWSVLLGQGAPGITVKATSATRLLVTSGEASSADAESAWVYLDGQGLPMRLEVDEGGDKPTNYRFGAWRFLAPRGRAWFVQAAPKGVEVVELQ